MADFDFKVKNDETGRPTYNPRVLLKLSMALCEGEFPHFTVIADLIARSSDDIQKGFINILLLAQEIDLLGNTIFDLDGCKLPSNASKGFYPMVAFLYGS